MNNMYDAVMKMEELLEVYEGLIRDLKDYMKDAGLDADDGAHPAGMLYQEAGRIYHRLLQTKKMEDFLRLEGEARLMRAMVSELRAGAWADLSGTVSKAQ